MSEGSKPRKTRWRRYLRRILHVKIVLIALAILAVAIFFGSGAGDPLLRRALVHRLEAMTGARVELRGLSIRWRNLRATLQGLVIHGREPADTEPLFAADEVQAALRIDSFWGRKFSLEDALIRAPRVHIRVEKDGRSNLPSPPARSASSKPFSERLFDMHIRKLTLQDGWILYNDVRAPLSVEGHAFSISLASGGAPGHTLYVGTVEWQQMDLTAKRYLPVLADVSVKFTLSHTGFTAEQAVLRFGHSQVDAQAELADFTNPDWKFRYRGWLRLEDLRTILRSPLTPAGRVDFRGEGILAKGQLRSSGGYSASEIVLNYPIFHAAGFTSRGSFRFNNDGAEVPEFTAEAFGGCVRGQVSMRLPGRTFLAQTHTEGASLAAILAATNRRDFPTEALHWDARLTADSDETWTEAFKHFEVSGTSNFSVPEKPAAAHIPVAGRAGFRYQQDPRRLTLSHMELSTASSRLSASGLLAANNSSLDVVFETGDLLPWNDFIYAIQGSSASSPDAVPIAGGARWDGRVVGPVAEPTFLGHGRGQRLRYGSLSWDLVEGDVVFSPSELSLTHTRARRGSMETEFDASLQLTRWRFRPNNSWSADANLEQASLQDMQYLLGASYPVHGRLTGQFHGRGTHAQPAVSGLFDLSEADAYGIAFNRLRGQINWAPEEVRIANAELRIFAPGTEAGRGAGIVTGSAGYRFADRNATFDLVGASLPLENFEKLHLKRLPVGGKLSFHLNSQGPLIAQRGEGAFRIVDLRVGHEVIGSFEGNLSSDGREAQLEVNSAMAVGKLSSTVRVRLEGEFPLTGKILVEHVDLDPFVQTALRLPELTGHGDTDGEILLSGALSRPQSLTIDANLTRLVLNYANVRLENAGPVRLRSSSDELRIDQATFRGTDTNLAVAGSVRFSGARQLALRLNGAWDLRLLTGFFPQLEARGPAQINADFEGSLDRPRITGRMHIENAAARLRDFPTGLNNLTGDFVFDATRLFFENVRAEAGGGTLSLAGTVSYADRPLRYDVTARSARIRIRYPEGMSWLAGGALRLTGTPDAALLSGRVSVERVTLSQGLQVAGMLVYAKEGITGPTTNSPFLRNLSFDVEAVSAPDVRLEWPGAELEAEANLRVRGTWEHPIMLGHIHILSGNMTFAGNRYRVTHGDLNFANPLRLDPVLNVEASTTIQQYEITLNFNGPASKLSLSYRSDPPLPATDIVTLLALGQTSSEAELRTGGTTQGGTTGAQALLSEAISSQLGGRLERLFGITRLRVDPGLGALGASGSSQTAAARVTVEQQVARNLTITYITDVTSTQQQVIQVEYNVDRNVSIVALRDQNGTFGLDIKFKKRFK